MISSFTIHSNGITQHMLLRPGDLSKTILFLHGNGSDSAFWNSIMQSIPAPYHLIAPDLRGYGRTQAEPANAKYSFGSYVGDLASLMDDLGIANYSIVAHSLGGGIAWELLLKDSHRINALVQVNPASPFGFGGTKDKIGSLTFPSGEGSGGGIVNPDFVKCLEKEDRTTDNLASPLNVMNAFYWAPPFSPENIEDLLNSLLRMKTGEKFYPGDFEASENFPFTKPGKFGQLNAASPTTKRHILQDLERLDKKPPIIWIRGGKDQIVSDESMFDAAVLGKLGLIPNYPGEETCPPQPMISQTRYVLDRYKESDGYYHEITMESCGHSPYIEDQSLFLEYLMSVLERING